jgi:hypothetical protein
MIRGSEAVVFVQKAREVSQDYNALESMNMEVRYVGTKPTINGDYIIVDTLTQSRRLVIVNDGQVRCNGTVWHLDKFQQSTQRWFLIPKLTPEDLAFVKGLPTA